MRAAANERAKASIIMRGWVKMLTAAMAAVPRVPTMMISTLESKIMNTPSHAAGRAICRYFLSYPEICRIRLHFNNARRFPSMKIPAKKKAPNIPSWSHEKRTEIMSNAFPRGFPGKAISGMEEICGMLNMAFPRNKAICTSHNSFTQNNVTHEATKKPISCKEEMGFFLLCISVLFRSYTGNNP